MQLERVMSHQVGDASGVPAADHLGAAYGEEALDLAVRPCPCEGADGRERQVVHLVGFGSREQETGVGGCRAPRAAST